MKIRTFLISILSLCGALFTTAAGQANVAQTLNINEQKYFQYLGRSQLENNQLYIEYSGSGFEMKLDVTNSTNSFAINLNSYISSDLSDTVQYASVFIDNTFVNRISFAKGTNNNVTLCSNIATGQHDFRFVKDNEMQWSSLTISSVSLTNIKPLDVGIEQRDLIEIYGDSITCGYGNLAEQGATGFNFATESASDSYAGLLMKETNYRVNLISLSGVALAKSPFGSPYTMMDFYQSFHGQKYQMNKDKRKYVVINLGTNDTTAINQAAESEKPAIIETYRANLRTMLQTFHELNPDTKFIICKNMMINFHQGLVDAINIVLSDLPSYHIYTLDFENNTDGADGHPGRYAHIYNAHKLSAFIDRLDQIHYDDSSRYQQFWNNPDIIYNESVTFVQQSNGLVQGRLYYDVDQIISIKDYNLDREIDPNLLSVSNNILTIKNPVHTPGQANSIAYFTKENYAGDESSLSLNSYLAWVGVANASITSTPKYILHTEDIGISRMHFYVTYKRKSSSKWGGSTIDRQLYQLHNTITKLSNKEKINIVFNGDSIVTGAMTSAFLNNERRIHPERYGSNIIDHYSKPNEPLYSTGFGNELARIFDYVDPSKVNVVNTAVGGTISTWGAENVQSNILNYNPDLVVIGFGTNDGAYTYRTPVNTYKANINTMISAIKSQNPNAEIILFHAIKPNPESPQHCYMQNQYLSALSELSSSYYGVTVLNMYAMAEELYKRKLPIDMLANNINHPNDWLERVHVAALLSLFGVYDSDSFDSNEYLRNTDIYDPWGSGYSKSNYSTYGVEISAPANSAFATRVTINKKFKLDGLSFDFRGSNYNTNNDCYGFYFSKTNACQYYTEIGNTLVVSNWPLLWGPDSGQDRIYAYNSHDYNVQDSYMYTDANCTNKGFGLADKQMAMRHNDNPGYNISFKKINSTTWRVVFRELVSNTFDSFGVQNIQIINGKKVIIEYMKNSDVANFIDNQGYTYLNYFAFGSSGHEGAAIFDNVKRNDTSTVSFIDGNNVINKRLANNGELLSQLNRIPTKDGYLFEGWYKDSSLTNKWDFNSDIIYGDAKLYAKFIVNPSVKVKLFCKNYLHPEISNYNNDKTGYCRGDSGYYKLAKSAFANLTNAEKLSFNNDAQFAIYKERISSWAEANGEIFNGTTFVANQQLIANNLINVDNDNKLLIVLLTVVPLLTAGLFLLIKRRRVN